MEMKLYYAIKTSMLFEKTVLVPVDSVGNIHEAIDLVDAGVEVGSIDLLNEEAECDTDIKKVYYLTDRDAECYEIVRGDK